MRNPELARLLTQGIKSIASRQNRTVSVIQDELAVRCAQAGGTLELSGHAVQKWRQEGYVPREEYVEVLARTCVIEGGMERGWLSAMLHQARYYDRQRLLDALCPERRTGLPGNSKPYQNLPPRYGEFVERPVEMSRVMEGLVLRYPLISIEGMGGVGKTSLALSMAWQCLEEGGIALAEPFQAVVWVSAKDRPDQQHWLNEVLDTIARVVDFTYITQLEPDSKLSAVDKLLRTHKVLLVVDNLETIKDPELEQWLCRLPEPSRAILTTRYGQMRAVWPVHLAGLGDGDALRLIRRHIKRLELKGLEGATDEHFLPLVRVTEGNPKAIELALGYIKRGMLTLEEVVNHLYKANVTVNDVFDYLFTNTWEQLDEHARSLLMATAFFVDSTSKEALGAVADLEGYRLDMALGQLNDRSFLNPDNQNLRYSIHPLIRAFANGRLQIVSDWGRIGRERWLEWYRGIATLALDSANYPRLNHEIPNLIGLLEWLAMQRRMTELAWFFQRLEKLLYAGGYWTHFLHYADDILTWAEQSNNPDLFRRTLHYLINIVRRHQSRGVAQNWLEIAQAFVNRTGNELLQAEVWLGQGRLWHERGQERVDSMQKALAIFERHNEMEKVAQTLNHLGNVYVRLGNYEVAEQYYREGLGVLEAVTPEFDVREKLEWEAVINGNLGIVLGRQGHYEEANQIIADVLPRLVDKTDHAEAYAFLAYNEYQQGNMEQAFSYRSQADELMSQLGLTEPISEEDRLWRRLNHNAEE
jgi:LuxR family glucitol operon transcriptional activator